MPEVKCPVCGARHESWAPHLTHHDLRKRIQLAGMPFIESLPGELQNLAGDLMGLNEDWVILHPDTLGADFILDTGFTDNQQRWLRELVPFFTHRRPPRRPVFPTDEIPKSIWLPAAYMDVIPPKEEF